MEGEEEAPRSLLPVAAPVDESSVPVPPPDTDHQVASASQDAAADSKNAVAAHYVSTAAATADGNDECTNETALHASVRKRVRKPNSLFDVDVVGDAQVASRDTSVASCGTAAASKVRRVQKVDASATKAAAAPANSDSRMDESRADADDPFAQLRSVYMWNRDILGAHSVSEQCVLDAVAAAERDEVSSQLAADQAHLVDRYCELLEHQTLLLEQDRDERERRRHDRHSTANDAMSLVITAVAAAAAPPAARAPATARHVSSSSLSTSSASSSEALASAATAGDSAVAEGMRLPPHNRALAQPTRESIKLWRDMTKGADMSPTSMLVSKDSVLARVNLRELFTLDVFDALPETVRERLVPLLPACDQSAAGLVELFEQNPWFDQSVFEFQDCLSKGAFDPDLAEVRSYWKGKKEREQRDSWKEQRVEEYWGEKIHIRNFRCSKTIQPLLRSGSKQATATATLSLLDFACDELLGVKSASSSSSSCIVAAASRTELAESPTPLAEHAPELSIASTSSSSQTIASQSRGVSTKSNKRSSAHADASRSATSVEVPAASAAPAAGKSRNRRSQGALQAGASPFDATAVEVEELGTVETSVTSGLASTATALNTTASCWCELEVDRQRRIRERELLQGLLREVQNRERQSQDLVHKRRAAPSAVEAAVGLPALQALALFRHSRNFIRNHPPTGHSASLVEPEALMSVFMKTVQVQVAARTPASSGGTRKPHYSGRHSSDAPPTASDGAEVAPVDADQDGEAAEDDDEYIESVHQDPLTGAITFCVCVDALSEKGFMLLCDMCHIWLHGVCDGLARAEDVPNVYSCPRCRAMDHPPDYPIE